MKTLYKLTSILLINLLFIQYIAVYPCQAEDNLINMALLSPRINILTQDVLDAYSYRVEKQWLFNEFTPLEKAPDEVGGEYQGDDGGSKPQSSMSVRERNSLTGFTARDGILDIISAAEIKLGKIKTLVFLMESIYLDDGGTKDRGASEEGRKLEDALCILRGNMNGSERETAYLRLLSHDNMFVRRQAISDLSREKVFSQRSIPALRRLLGNDHPHIQWTVLDILLQLDVREVIPEIIKLCSGQDWSVSLAALSTLIKMNVSDEELTAAWQLIVNNPSDLVREDALEKFGGNFAGKGLIDFPDLLNDASSKVKKEAAKLIVKYFEKIPDADKKVIAISLLEDFKADPESYIGALRLFFEHNYYSRHVYASSMVYLLAKALKSPYWQVMDALNLAREDFAKILNVFNREINYLHLIASSSELIRKSVSNIVRISLKEKGTEKYFELPGESIIDESFSARNIYEIFCLLACRDLFLFLTLGGLNDKAYFDKVSLDKNRDLAKRLFQDFRNGKIIAEVNMSGKIEKWGYGELLKPLPEGSEVNFIVNKDFLSEPDVTILMQAENILCLYNAEKNALPESFVGMAI